MTDTGRTTVFTGPLRMPAERPTGSVFVHLILFKMYNTADETVRDEALRLMVTMCEQAEGVLKYVLTESDDTRKGHILSEYMVFESKESFEDFKQTPAHQEYANFIRDYADWIIADNTVPALALMY